MATSPVSKDFELSATEKALLIDAIGTHRAVLRRAYNAEKIPEIQEFRAVKIRECDALEARFR